MDIVNASPETVNAFGWQIQRGYVFKLIAADDSAWDCSEHFETDDGAGHVELRQFGYHGNDVPPCGADYLYCSDDGSEFLVISAESDPANIATVDGFTLEPVTLETGDERHDGTWRFVVLSVDHDGQTVIAGKA